MREFSEVSQKNELIFNQNLGIFDSHLQGIHIMEFVSTVLNKTAFEKESTVIYTILLYINSKDINKICRNVSDKLIFFFTKPSKIFSLS